MSDSRQIDQPKLGDLVYVHWVDSRGCPRGWVWLDEIEHGPALVDSIGWAAKVEADYICLAPHVIEETQGAASVMGLITIPRECIRTVQVVSGPTSSLASRDQDAATEQKQQPISPTSVSPDSATGEKR